MLKDDEKVTVPLTIVGGLILLFVFFDYSFSSLKVGVVTDKSHIEAESIFTDVDVYILNVDGEIFRVNESLFDSIFVMSSYTFTAGAFSNYIYSTGDVLYDFSNIFKEFAFILLFSLFLLARLLGSHIALYGTAVISIFSIFHLKMMFGL